MIIIRDLRKKYGYNAGNFDINLEVREGEVYGVLGPNGAGKTTLIRQIMGFIKFDSDSILINVLNPWTNTKEIMEDVGYVAGEISLYENLKGIEYLKLLAKFKKNFDENFLETWIVKLNGTVINKKTLC